MVNKQHTILTVSRSYTSQIKSLLPYFKNNSIFKWTGADPIESDFNEEGKFQLHFASRGRIWGTFISIAPGSIRLKWNVEGFGRPNEINTFVELILLNKGNSSEIKILHSNLLLQDSFEAKKKAWEEILAKFEE